MLRIFKIVITIIVISYAAYGIIRADNELPFGAWSSQHADKVDPYDDDMLTTLHDTLGFNVWNSGGFNEYQVGRWYDDGIMSIPVGIYADTNGILIDSLTEAHYKYSLAQYLIVQAEDESSDFRFKINNESTPDDTILVYSEPDAVMLDDLVFTQTRTEHALHGWQEEVLYTPYLKIGYLRESWTDSSDVLGRFRVIPTDDTTDVRLDTLITAGQLPSDSTLTLLELGEYTTWDTSWDLRNVRFQFIKPDSHTVMIDYFKVHCQEGDNLIDLGEYDDEIKESAARKAYEGKIHAWYLRDEPKPGHFSASGYVNSLIKQAMLDSLWDESNRVEGMQNFIIRNPGIKDFIRLADPNRLFLHLYPYLGGGDGTALVLYTGTTWFNGDDHPIGLQASLNYKIARQADTARGVISETSNSVVEWWYTAQAFASTDERWRAPTNSEFRCALYLGMCYQPRGIVYWKFDGTTSKPFSITDTNYEPTRLWTVIEDEINPYIKAIDSKYLDLTWEDAYYIGADSAMPAGWIDTIYATSNSSDPNPDLGWFHVGEFTEGSDKYIMLVNRACSQGEDDPTPAPSITATVKFDAGNLGWNYVYIIDIADSVDYVDYDSVAFWPDTTYSAKLNGTIPFTTVLGPGEGRLFKIVGTNQLNLIDTINTNYTYQGKIKVTADAVVPADSVMKIRGPAELHAYRCPTDSSGVDSFKVEIIVNGTLDAEGTASDSVFFISDTTPCGHPLLPDDPEPGDWYGIYFDEDADGTLEYCSIQYATYGIEMRKNSEVGITDCSIGNNSIAGVYNFGGSLDLANSTVSDNGTYGLFGYRAADSVYNTHFLDNESYGIKIEGTKLTNDSTFLLCDTLSYLSSPSQYGILVDKNDYIRIDQCKISGYDQGAIRLTSSDALISNSNFTSTVDYSTYYGIYAGNTSYPYVRSCLFDSVRIGVKVVTPAKPDLGIDSQGEYGNSSFLACSTFVHYSGLTPATYDTLWAQRNWWGNPVDPTKFYTDDPINKVIRWWPPLLQQPKMEIGRQIPLMFSLQQNYPNPFNPTTTISFTLEKPAHTVITIYNILGQKIATPVNEYLGIGEQSVFWNGRNSSGIRVSSGVYFYTIESGDHFNSKKMLLLR